MYDSDQSKAELNLPSYSITFNQAWLVFNKPSTKRHFIDFKHSTVLEVHYYALGKLRNHGVIRIDYVIRDGRIRISNAFKAGQADTDRYYFGEEDF